ncbi:MAG: DUF5658 family protein [Fimbriimonadales bacterium]|nr:DUF5658 family protein [Fimbriimonadales bacterium]
MRRVFGLISPESWAIIGLCLADLGFTLWLLSRGLAEEANPLMHHYLGYGVGAFVGVKLILIMAPVIIIEWGLRLRPQTVRRLARAGVYGYISLYALLHLGFNVPDAIAHRFEPTNYPPVDRELLRLEREGLIPPFYTDGTVAAIPQEYLQFAEAAWTRSDAESRP